MQTVTVILTVLESNQVCSHFISRILCICSNIGCVRLSYKKKVRNVDRDCIRQKIADFDESGGVVNQSKEIEV